MKVRFGFRLLGAVGAAIVCSGLVVPAVAASATNRAGLSSADAAVTYTTFGWQNKPYSAPVVLAGTFTNAPVGSSAQLFVKVFPFSGSMKPGQKQQLNVGSGGRASFAFSIRPLIATEYWVKLINPDGSVNGTFPLQTVYVVSARTVQPDSESCVKPTCHVTFTLLRYLPPSVSKYELTKPYDDYVGITWAQSKTPPTPTEMNLAHGWTVSKTTAVPNVTDEVEATFTFSFTLKEPFFSYASTACTIDSVTTDGFGLPGSHGCGDAQVPVDSNYLG